eukprot:m.137661 g.137661  ORF g.137661 m.137661 type:complete len:213 (-) comp12100_c0_seq1:95-733(-)
MQSVKKAFRKEMKLAVAAISPSQKESLSHLLFTRLVALKEFSAATRIAYFLSMDDEIRTKEMIEHSFNHGKTCFVPRYTKTDMNMYKIFDMDDVSTLPRTKWDIQQPEDDLEAREDPIQTDGLDIIIVPGLGFGRDGGRLGRGGGYYDQYLERFKEALPEQKQPLLIAVTFDCQLHDTVPTSNHDRKVHVIITPTQTIYCKNEEKTEITNCS